MKTRSAIVFAALLLVSGSAFGETKEEVEIRNAQSGGEPWRPMPRATVEALLAVAERK